MMIKLNVGRFVVLCVFLLVFFSSCTNGDYPTTQTKFKVYKVQVNPSSASGSTILYLVRPIENLNTKSIWFVDSVGKFNVGDTLGFGFIKK